MKRSNLTIIGLACVVLCALAGFVYYWFAPLPCRVIRDSRGPAMQSPDYMKQIAR